MSVNGKIIGVVGAYLGLTRSGNTITLSAPAGGSVVIAGQSFTSLTVSGALTAGTLIAASGKFSVNSSGNLDVQGTTLLEGAVNCLAGLSIPSGNLVVQVGNTIIGGSLSVANGNMTVDVSANLYTSGNANVGSLTGPSNILPLKDGSGNAAALQFLERGSDPSAPASSTAILYLRDNGSGKAQLCIQFPTGSPVVIVTEA